MIDPEDEIIIDFRTSCTKDEAVAKLIGWMIGPIRRKNAEVTEHDISSDHLAHLYSFDESLHVQLGELREVARLKLIDAAESDGDIHEAYVALDKCDELIRKAATYLLDIDDEISKGESSDLRIDRQAMDSSGIIHITIKSLDKWARREYKIGVIEASVSNTANANIQSHPEIQGDGKYSGNGLSKTKADNLYISFAFLIEAFINKIPKYGSSDKPTNVSAIAEQIEKIAKEANNNEKLSGQSDQAIRDRIEDAFKIKRSKLPMK